MGKPPECSRAPRLYNAARHSGYAWGLLSGACIQILFQIPNEPKNCMRSLRHPALKLSTGPQDSMSRFRGTFLMVRYRWHTLCLISRGALRSNETQLLRMGCMPILLKHLRASTRIAMPPWDRPSKRDERAGSLRGTPQSLAVQRRLRKSEDRLP